MNFLVVFTRVVDGGSLRIHKIVLSVSLMTGKLINGKAVKVYDNIPEF